MAPQSLASPSAGHEEPDAVVTWAGLLREAYRSRRAEDATAVVVDLEGTAFALPPLLPTLASSPGALAPPALGGDAVLMEEETFAPVHYSFMPAAEDTGAVHVWRLRQGGFMPVLESTALRPEGLLRTVLIIPVLLQQGGKSPQAQAVEAFRLAAEAMERVHSRVAPADLEVLLTARRVFLKKAFFARSHTQHGGQVGDMATGQGGLSDGILAPDKGTSRVLFPALGGAVATGTSLRATANAAVLEDADRSLPSLPPGVLSQNLGVPIVMVALGPPEAGAYSGSPSRILSNSSSRGPSALSPGSDGHGEALDKLKKVALQHGAAFIDLSQEPPNMGGGSPPRRNEGGPGAGQAGTALLEALLLHLLFPEVHAFRPEFAPLASPTSSGGNVALDLLVPVPGAPSSPAGSPNNRQLREALDDEARKVSHLQDDAWLRDLYMQNAEAAAKPLSRRSTTGQAMGTGGRRGRSPQQSKAAASSSSGNNTGSSGRKGRGESTPPSKGGSTGEAGDPTAKTSTPNNPKKFFQSLLGGVNSSSGGGAVASNSSSRSGGTTTGSKGNKK
uniref:Uncharacterized protein n=1 Tax=Rhizochromulina marina TaxID=1034831 RepID=A0A6U1B7M8_9STRA